ncbi:hypothetical protein ACFWMU_39300 [Streptomyces sp. NPDC058357]|uniref:hypothetical protein n=1 Tax=unclassified Streptomyces TaxID=2593676 RepID=UPI00364FA82C
MAKRLGRTPSTVPREIARNGGRNLYRAASADATAYTRAPAQAVRARPTARSARPGGSARGTGSVTGRGRSSERFHDVINAGRRAFCAAGHSPPGDAQGSSPRTRGAGPRHRRVRARRTYSTAGHVEHRAPSGLMCSRRSAFTAAR